MRVRRGATTVTTIPMTTVHDPSQQWSIWMLAVVYMDASSGLYGRGCTFVVSVV